MQNVLIEEKSGQMNSIIRQAYAGKKHRDKSMNIYNPKKRTFMI